MHLLELIYQLVVFTNLVPELSILHSEIFPFLEAMISNTLEGHSEGQETSMFLLKRQANTHAYRGNLMVIFLFFYTHK